MPNVGSILAKDLFLNALAVFIALVVVLLPWLNPPAKSEDTTAPPGSLIVTITWDEGDTDIDLWVRGPGESKAVGYSNKAGAHLNLLRDDLGNVSDPLPLNYENLYSRGLNPGKYVVNVHGFRFRSAGPVRVNVEVAVVQQYGVRRLITTHVAVAREGQELTVAAFELTKDGTLAPGSLHNVFTPLREARKE